MGATTEQRSGSESEAQHQQLEPGGSEQAHAKPPEPEHSGSGGEGAPNETTAEGSGDVSRDTHHDSGGGGVPDDSGSGSSPDSGG